MYGSGLCRSCANIGKKNPMIGSKRFSGKNNPMYIDGRSCIIRHCVDCGNILSKNGKTRCIDCYVKHMKGKNHPCFINGKPNCIDCGKQVSDYKSIRCLKCFIKYKKENVKPTVNYCCMDCGDLISLPTALNGGGLCKICCRQGNKHPRYGVKLSNKTKNKISKSLIGKMVGDKCPAYKDGRTLKKHYCKCGNEISYNSKYNRTGMCSSCARSGENNPNYVHGQGHFPYPLTFNNKLKESIRERDNYACQICGLKEKNNLRINKPVNLPIHHIDYNKDNCSFDNLISLCCKCHTKTNFNRDYWYAYCKYVIEGK